MTFIACLPTHDYGLVATDTRSRSQGRFTDSLGSKLRDLGGGTWGAGAGLKQWTSRALDVIADLDVFDLAAIAGAVRPIAQSWEVQEVVASLTADERSNLAHWAATRAIKDGVQTGTLGKVAVVYRSVAGYSCFTVDDAGMVQQYPRGQLYLSAPPGLEPAALRAYVAATWTALPRSRDEIVRRVADLIQWAASKTEYMSGRMELVYMTRAGDVHLPPMPAADLLREHVVV